MTIIRSAPPPNPLVGFQVDPSSMGRTGRDLQRPECILAERDGSLWSADARGGVVRIAADGTQQLIRQISDEPDKDRPASPSTLITGTLPNGLAFARGGDILISNFGTDRLERMTRGGRSSVLLDSIEGRPLGKVNFVLRDSRDRIWLTVSTRINPWTEAMTGSVADGFIVLIDERGARIVADGFRFTNEIRFDAAEEWLYVAETTGKCVTRLRARPNGALVDRETFGPSSLGRGVVDGIAFDSYGNLWATMIFADRLIAITPKGDLLELFNDGEYEATERFESAFATGLPVPMDVMLKCGGPVGRWLASVTFGASIGRRTAMAGSSSAIR